MDKYAIFFPQFHQVKVNDDAWGVGFTDWALVASANAFDAWERRAPAGGFYDLNKPSEVSKQFQAAADAGLNGFGIYHYWFEDGSELSAVERYLSDGLVPDKFGYFFIWANESWSRRWAGKDTELLKTVAKRPTRLQVREHVEYLKPFMVSEGYKRVDGRPVFVVYRPEFFSDLQSSIDLYKEEFSNAGIDVSLGYFVSGISDVDYSDVFDFCYLFEPRLFFKMNGVGRSRWVSYFFRWLTHNVSYEHIEAFSAFVNRVLGRNSKSYDFSRFVEYFKSAGRSSIVNSITCPVQNVLTCGWNNAPRYRDGFVALKAPSGAEFKEIVSISVEDSRFSKKYPLMCNAWNEWSEGAALEECSYLGSSLQEWYLQAQNN